MNYTRKDNRIYTLKSIDEVMLKDSKDLFVVKLDGSKLHTYDEFEKVAKAAFQTPTDESMIWLNTPGNPFCWIEYLDWLMDAGFNSFALIVENWSKRIAKRKKIVFCGILIIPVIIGLMKLSNVVLVANPKTLIFI